MNSPSDLPPDFPTNVSSSRPVPLDHGAPTLAPDARVGQYRLVKELGRGGMGVVYEAEDKLGRKVALKVMNPPADADAQTYRSRFLREGKAVAQLNSDHVVRVHYADEHDGALYLAMEYIDGPTLEGWLKGRPTPAAVADVLWVARDLLSGLAAAHAQNLIHRDVKPANVMFDTATGRFRLLDFGLVRDVGPEAATATVGVIGTPTYMSPEQANAKPLDARTDLFSTGVVLYRMVAGGSPFVRGSMTATLIALSTETPPPLKNVPPALSKFVARLMARDPKDRPKDAVAALTELRKLKKELTGDESADEEPEGPEPRSSRKLTYAVLGAVVVLLAVAAAVLLTRGKPKDEVAQTPPAPKQPEPNPKGESKPKADANPIPVPKVEPKPARPFSSADVLKLIVADIDARPGPKAEDDKPTRLYLFAPHLAPGSTLTADERKEYRTALGLLSANLKPGGELLRPLDGEKTVFAVEPSGEFRAPDGLFSEYPYGLTFEQPESLRRDDSLIREYTGPVAFVRADWFLRYAVKRMADRKAVFGTTGSAAQKTEEWAKAWSAGAVGLPAAAEELGADPEQVKRVIAEKGAALRAYQLGPLADGKTIPRVRWESREFASSAFQELARELNIGLPALTR